MLKNCVYILLVEQSSFVKPNSYLTVIGTKRGTITSWLSNDLALLYLPIVLIFVL